MNEIGQYKIKNLKSLKRQNFRRKAKIKWCYKNQINEPYKTLRGKPHQENGIYLEKTIWTQRQGRRIGLFSKGQ